MYWPFLFLSLLLAGLGCGRVGFEPQTGALRNGDALSDENQDEEKADLEESCPECRPGLACRTDADCPNSFCDNQVCLANACAEHPKRCLWVDAAWSAAALNTEVAPGRVVGVNAYPQVATAVAAASEGDAISIAAGTYRERINIDKPLTIKGKEGAKLIGDTDQDGIANGPVIELRANDIRLSGLDISMGTFNIQGYDIKSCAIENNVIHDAQNSVRDAGAGITLWGDNDNNVIANNQIYDNDRQGVFIGYSDTSRVSSGNAVRDNIIHDNGLYRMKNNGTDEAEYGIQLWYADASEVSNNVIYNHKNWQTGGSAVAIFLTSSSATKVFGNTIYNNLKGILAWGPSTDVHDNIFCRNTTYAVEAIGASNAVSTSGNWWGHSSGPTGGGGSGDRISSYVTYAPPSAPQPSSGPCAP